MTYYINHDGLLINQAVLIGTNEPKLGERRLFFVARTGNATKFRLSPDFDNMGTPDTR